MEGNKKAKGASSSSSSSFTSDLFGFKENSAPPSSGIFGSIFPPNKASAGGESFRSEEIGRKQTSVNPGTYSRSNEGKMSESNEISLYYQEQRVQQPCHLSSSIYYGGQDIYSRPQTTQPGMINKDEGEDDSGSASRGNWWKGSLYY